MKKLFYLSLSIIFSAFIISSCEENNEAPKPEISMHEFGYEDSGMGSPGSDFHIEADILAEGKIDVIIIEIHPEDEHKKNSPGAISNEEKWDVDTTYTKFSGLKNTDFHEHLEIPANAEHGHYHFHLKVNDMEGNQTSLEREIEITDHLDSHSH